MSTWRSWQLNLTAEPKIVHELANGKTNRTFLIELNHPQYPLAYLRLFAPNSALYNINRQREKIIHTAAAEAGISPAILHWDDALSFSLTAAIEGRNWNHLDFDCEFQCRRLFKVVREYQTLKLNSLPEFNYLSHLNHYSNFVYDFLSESEKIQWLRFKHTLANWQIIPWPRALTHHDLNADNIIESKGRLFILDWEYAGLGHPMFDWLDINEKCVNSPDELDLLQQLRSWLIRFWQLL